MCIGTTRTSCAVRFCAAIGGITDVERALIKHAGWSPSLKSLGRKTGGRDWLTLPPLLPRQALARRLLFPVRPHVDVPAAALAHVNPFA